MTEKHYTVGYFDEPTDIDDYVECNGEYLSSSEVVDRLNKLSEEYSLISRAYMELEDDNAILKQVLTKLVEAFDDNISDKSPIRDLIKITNHCSSCKECYFVDKSKKFICNLNKKEVNYATPACENFDESRWRKKFKDIRNAIVDNITKDFFVEKKKSLLNIVKGDKYDGRRNE